MKSFEKTTFINCEIEELFEFHLDVNNIKKITPPDIKVKLLTKDFVAKEGNRLEIKTVKNYLPTFWEVEIKELKKPYLLVDDAIRSPFKYWQHSHVFSKKGNMCELKDIVVYESPVKIFGNLIEFFIDSELKNMFDYRHKITKEILEKRINN